ncbi:hypothetical protein [Spiribacter onubensis]|uniref:Uncharacterized protein n=1 Tax=Spiribacter onubensis TaxID=3122420 RepID=A0ABV3S6V5_9GAMM
MTNDEIIAELNAAAEADDSEFREACTLAALTEMSVEVVALAMDIGVPLTEEILDSVDGDATDCADGITAIIRHVRERYRGIQ